MGSMFLHGKTEGEDEEKVTLGPLFLDVQSTRKTVNWGNHDSFGIWSKHSPPSGLSTPPFGSSDLWSSTETDDVNESELEDNYEDFIAQLTRQMADYMLNDDNDDEEAEVAVNDNDVGGQLGDAPNSTATVTQPCEIASEWWSNYSSSSICYYNQESLGTCVQPTPEYTADDQLTSYDSGMYSNSDLTKPIQVYYLQDQPCTRKRRVKGTTSSVESCQTEQSSVEDVDPQHMKSTTTTKSKMSGGYGDGRGPSGKYQFPVPLQSMPVSSGTGVFLPQARIPTPKEPSTRKKSRCKMLVPTRVLQTLQQHFNNMDALSYSLSFPPLPQKAKEGLSCNNKENGHSDDDTRQLNIQVNCHEMQLPQEWTY